jgi:signal peptidase II
MAKRGLTLSLALIALDQAVKLIISHFAMNATISLIPGVLTFHPTQNLNLNWLASMAGYQTPVWLMVVVQVLVLVIITLASRFITYESGSRQPWLNVFTIFITAGIGCSFIDVVFWGGSLDFAGLFNWFVFDIKDLYLNTACVFLVLWVIKKEIETKQDPTNEHSWRLFFPWMRAGCPAQKPQMAPQEASELGQEPEK